MRTLVFDTETTGIPLWHDPSDDPRQPHIVELACELYKGQELLERYHSIINPGIPIPPDVAAIHGITTEIAQEQGCAPAEAVDHFFRLAAGVDLLAGHNVSFDVRMMRITTARVRGEKWEPLIPTFCTMRKSTNICRILGERAPSAGLEMAAPE